MRALEDESIVGLQAIDNQPGLVRDPYNGSVLQLSEFQPAEEMWPVHRDRYHMRNWAVPPGATWVVRGWNIYIDPFPKYIDPELQVRLMADHLICAELPLFRLAEPLHHDAALERRIELLEKELKIPDPERQARERPITEVRPAVAHAFAEVSFSSSEGPLSDKLMMLHETSKHIIISVRLAKRRAIVR